MSRLDELIQELCPDGVEYKKLGEVATVSRGGSFQKKDYVEDGVPCIHYGQIYVHYNLFVDKTISFISEETAKKQKFAEPNDVIMAVTSENLDDVCKCVAWLGAGKVAVSGHTAIIHHTLHPKYLVYYLHSSMFYAQKAKLAHGTKVIEVTPATLENVIIPVPPIEVQHEIVRILDKFTELSAELSAELSERQRQYSYYRDTLLEHKAEYTYVSLGDCCSFVRGPFGGSLKKEIFVSKGYAVYEQQNAIYGKMEFRYFITREKYEQMQRFKVNAGDIIMSCSGTMGKVTIIPDDAPEGVINQALLKITPGKNILSKYLKYVMESSVFTAAILADARGGAIQNVASVDTLKRIRIALPPLDIQRRIIHVLDNFDTICSDLQSGLPAEIEARQKQYEYYRDKLLTFKPLA